MSSSLLDCLATTDALAAVFNDAGVLQAMLDVEAALAQASAAAGVIPEAAALTISAVARHGGLDAAAIASGARAAATPAIPLVEALRARVRALDESSAAYVHWGATSQDITDTALILLLQRARPILAADHERIERALRQLSERHAGTIMLGRTLLQPATPITFGLKVAGWVSAVVRSWRRLDRAWEAVSAIQLGGAAGTLAAFGEHGPAIAATMARELALRSSPPWHADRDRLAALVAACGLYVAALGKAARDISLLMQAEVREAAEPGGGSSTMPQKQNPSGCVLVIAAASRLPGLVGSSLGAMLHEHERGAGGLQAEWPIVSSAVQATGAAAAALAGVVEGLMVNPARMRQNLEATGGTIFAERAALGLAGSMGHDRARQLVAEAVATSRRTGSPFAAAAQSLAADAGLSGVLHDVDRPEAYLGAAETIRRQLLDEADE